ncbi:MAG: hypothetical protein IPP69_15750 [Flavobacteriales bacterium]|nr:hypothetical protein [Flavobacteriales bacterium]
MILYVDKTNPTPSEGNSQGYTAYRDLGPRPKCVICDDIPDCPDCPADQAYKIPVVAGDKIYRQFWFSDLYNTDPEEPEYGWYGEDNDNYYVKATLEFGSAPSIALDDESIIASQNVGYYNGSFQNIVLDTTPILEYINAEGYEVDCFRLVVTSYKLDIGDHYVVIGIFDTPPITAGKPEGSYVIIGTTLNQLQDGIWVGIAPMSDGDIVFAQKPGKYYELNTGVWSVVDPDSTRVADQTCSTAWYKFLMCSEPSIIIEGVYGTQDCNGFYYGQTSAEAAAGLLSYRDRYRIEASFELQSFPTEKTTNENGDVASFKQKENWLLRTFVGLPESIARRVANSFAAPHFYVNSNEYQTNTDVRKVNEQGLHWFLSVVLERVSCEKLSECNDEIFFNPIVVCDECTEATCDEVTVLRDGVFYDTAPCGSTIDVPSDCGPSDECAEATVHNNLNTYSDTVASGGDLTLPYIQVTEINGSSYPYDSVTDFICSWVPLEVQDQDGNVLANVNTYPTGEVITVNIPECILMEHKTTAEVQALIDGGPSDERLIEGVIYHVTDLAGTDCGGYLTALSEDTLSLHGEGCFLNPDFQSVGDYSGVFGLTGIAYTANQGVWYALLELTLVDGDVVIWDGKHYQVTDIATSNGSSPSSGLNTSYTELPKSSDGMGYVAEQCFIEFDWDAAEILLRQDTRGNNICNASLELFRFGDDVCHHNTVLGVATFENLNVHAAHNTNVIKSGSVQLNGNGNAEFIGNTVYGSNTIVTTHPSITVNIYNCIFNSTGTITLYDEPTEQSVIGNFSSMIGSVDITGDSSIDMDDVKSYAGIVNLISSNATETCDKIINPPTGFDFDIRPEEALVVTLTGTSIGSLSANGQIVMPTASLVLNGSNGENAKFRVRQIGIYYALVQIDANNSYL